MDAEVQRRAQVERAPDKQTGFGGLRGVEFVLGAVVTTTAIGRVRTQARFAQLLAPERPMDEVSQGGLSPATPPLKICVPVLLEGGVESVDGGFDRDRLMDDRHVAGVPLGGLDELLVEVAGRAHVDGEFLAVERQVQHAGEAAPVLVHVLRGRHLEQDAWWWRPAPGA